MRALKNWVEVVSFPLLLASVGCAVNSPFASTHQALPPERLMAMGHALERQGHPDQARFAYEQVVAMRPDFPNAKQSLDGLIAKEMRKNQIDGLAATPSGGVMMSQSQPHPLVPSTMANVPTPASVETIRVTNPEPQLIQGHPGGQLQSMPVGTTSVIQQPPAALPEQDESPQASTLEYDLTIAGMEFTETANDDPVRSSSKFPVAIPAAIVRPAGATADYVVDGSVEPTSIIPCLTGSSKAYERWAAPMFVQPAVPSVTHCSWLQSNPSCDH